RQDISKTQMREQLYNGRLPVWQIYGDICQFWAIIRIKDYFSIRHRWMQDCINKRGLFVGAIIFIMRHSTIARNGMRWQVTRHFLTVCLTLFSISIARKNNSALLIINPDLTHQPSVLPVKLPDCY